MSLLQTTHWSDLALPLRLLLLPDEVPEDLEDASRLYALHCCHTGLPTRSLCRQRKGFTDLTRVCFSLFLPFSDVGCSDWSRGSAEDTCGGRSLLAAHCRYVSLCLSICFFVFPLFPVCLSVTLFSSLPLSPLPLSYLSSLLSLCLVFALSVCVIRFDGERCLQGKVPLA